MVKKIVILLFLCLIPCVTSAEFKLPDTGQTKCYQAVEPYAEIPCNGTGQDGAYTINPMSYTDNGNGTVTDNNTGLMWQKCSVGQNNDSSCSGDAAAYNWYQASGTYDATYNASSQNVCGSLTLGGQTDWRLPTKKELMSIADYSVPYPGPTINAAFSHTHLHQTTGRLPLMPAVPPTLGSCVSTLAKSSAPVRKTAATFGACVADSDWVL